MLDINRLAGENSDPALDFDDPWVTGVDDDDRAVLLRTSTALRRAQSKPGPRPRLRSLLIAVTCPETGLDSDAEFDVPRGCDHVHVWLRPTGRRGVAEVEVAGQFAGAHVPLGSHRGRVTPRDDTPAAGRAVRDVLLAKALLDRANETLGVEVVTDLINADMDSWVLQAALARADL